MGIEGRETPVLREKFADLKDGKYVAAEDVKLTFGPKNEQERATSHEIGTAVISAGTTFNISDSTAFHQRTIDVNGLTIHLTEGCYPTEEVMVYPA